MYRRNVTGGMVVLSRSRPSVEQGSRLGLVSHSRGRK